MRTSRIAVDDKQGELAEADAEQVVSLDDWEKSWWPRW